MLVKEAPDNQEMNNRKMDFSVEVEWELVGAMRPWATFFPCVVRYYSHTCSWWRHQMETFSASLALCAGIHRLLVNSPHKGQWCGALIVSLSCAWINGWVNNRGAGDLKLDRAHYDNIIILWQFIDPNNLVKSCIFQAAQFHHVKEQHVFQLCALCYFSIFNEKFHVWNISVWRCYDKSHAVKGWCNNIMKNSKCFQK